MKKRSLLLAPSSEMRYDDISYPCYASYKLDGVRVLAYDGELFSRNWKIMGTGLHIRFRELLKKSRECKLVFDGEIYMHTCAFSELMGLIKPSAKSIPEDVKYYVFDGMTKRNWDSGKCQIPFMCRLDNIKGSLTSFKLLDDRVNIIPQVLLTSPTDAAEYFDKAIDDGYEGLIIRSSNGMYKHGRATLKEATIFKFKKNATIDAQIIGYERATRMTSETKAGTRKRDEMGYLERSGEKHTREEYDGIGAIKVKTKEGLEFKATRAKDAEFPIGHINWENKDTFIGKWVEVKYMNYGIKAKPRFPHILRFRGDLDD